VRESLTELVAGRQGRVAITSFASNIARIETAAAVARAAERHLVVVGRSLWRMLRAAGKTGYADGMGPVLEAGEGGYLPPEKVLYLCTGCQGEPRGAMARIAGGSHPDVTLEAGDLVIFSSKVIPGNERAIGRLQDQLALAGVEVVGEKDGFVHVSGHPCRDELRRMYQWVRPAIAVPVHGEARHLAAHVALAAELQVPDAVGIENGRMLRLAPGRPEIIHEVQSGRRYLDGGVLSSETDMAVRERRRLMYNGLAAVTLLLDPDGGSVAPPSLVFQGIPRANGEANLDLLVLEAVETALASLPAAVRRDDGRVAEAARVAARRALRDAIGKRPVVEARVVRLNARR
jgi:ribonuclease J